MLPTPGDGLSAGGHQIVIEQGGDSGEGRRGGGSSSVDGELAAGIDEVPIVIRRGGEGNIGNVARAVVRHAQAGLPRGLGEHGTGAAAARARIAGRAVIPDGLRNVGDGRTAVGIVGRVPVLGGAFAQGGAANAGDLRDVGGRIDRESRAVGGSAGRDSRRRRNRRTRSSRSCPAHLPGAPTIAWRACRSVT